MKQTLILSTILYILSVVHNVPSIEKALHTDTRMELIKKITANEANYAAANCFCRVGDHRGSKLDDYQNAYKDFGKIKRYTGLNQQGASNQADCGSRCSALAFKWASSLSDSALCRYFKKRGNNRLVAYSKVGTKSWTVRQTLKTVNCCLKGGTLTCPSGWGPENTNFPGKCSKAMCPPLVKGDRRLYNENGSVWGFIYNDMTYQLRNGTSTSSTWQTCN